MTLVRIKMGVILQKTTFLYSLLGKPFFYRLVQWGFDHKKTRSQFRELLGDIKGKKILDVGCGPGDDAEVFKEGTYIGIDISSNYINEANQSYGHIGQFFCTSIDDINDLNLSCVDVFILKGVLHHLSDTQIKSMMESFENIKNENAIVVTLDPVFFDNQGWCERVLAEMDRGEAVRHQEAYLQLIKPFCTNVETYRTHQFLPPYDRLLMKCHLV